MPQIYDNIDHNLITGIREALDVSYRADFCVGYFNLRGWKHIDDLIERFDGGAGACARVLIGMQPSPDTELRQALRIRGDEEDVDQAAVHRARRKLAADLREQLTFGVPTNEDEAALRRLARQLRSRKVSVKLFGRHSLHAKLYLMFRQDPINPGIGYVGSSNLTLAGLLKQGELNVDVLDRDAVDKLARWFEDRWTDQWSVDITDELAKVIDESWARETPIPPYHIFLKMAYHLSEEAREGMAQFTIPPQFDILRPHQREAVQIAAARLNRQKGVLIGDVVGLGKTLVGTAVARIMEDDRDWATLILCPKNLVEMWEAHRERYALRGTVVPTSVAARDLPNLRRYHLVLIDESHNLRNRNTELYRAVADYIEKNDSRCILMSATPYNMAFRDIAAQLRLFIRDDDRLPVRPEALLKEIGEKEFSAKHQCAPDSILAFEKSENPDDWRELLRSYLLRRTRSFIISNYAHKDDEGREYLELNDGSRSYFPQRRPRTLTFTVDPSYAALYQPSVVDRIGSLKLPRYGLGGYLADPLPADRTPDEHQAVEDLSRAGQRLKGFCKVNLYKRLESSGHAFLLSLRRHIVRNDLFLYALEHDLPIPIGDQDTAIFNTVITDNDDEGDSDEDDPSDTGRIAELYDALRANPTHRTRWIRAALFGPSLSEALRADRQVLAGILDQVPRWDASADGKLDALFQLVSRDHPDEKVLIFTEYADTARYLAAALKDRNVERVESVTGSSNNPTELARRFSPRSNEASIVRDREIRVLIATDVLSEGQNLQDAHIIVSYDLPWAIIRLIQRAGRVDRIGQTAPDIYCYTFLPADGIEKVITLRKRLGQRLSQNAEVIGTDEQFFPDDKVNGAIADLYAEKPGALGGDEGDTDLTSTAFEVWNRAAAADPALCKTIAAMPDVVHSTRQALPTEQTELEEAADSVLLYLRTDANQHYLAHVGPDGKIINQSASAIFDAARCEPDTPALPRTPGHFDLVDAGARFIVREGRSIGGQLGSRNAPRSRTYERLNDYRREISGMLPDETVDPTELNRAIDDIYQYPLTSEADRAIRRQLHASIDNAALAAMVLERRRTGRLCQIPEETGPPQATILCSMGLTRRAES